MNINRTLRKIKEKRISRRAFLKGATAAAGSLLLAGCGKADPEKLAALASAAGVALDKNRREKESGKDEDSKSEDSKSEDSRSRGRDSRSEDHDSKSEDPDGNNGGTQTPTAPTIDATYYDGTTVYVQWTPTSAGMHTIKLTGSDITGEVTTSGGDPGAGPFAQITTPMSMALTAGQTYNVQVCNGTACAADFPVNPNRRFLGHLAYDNTAGQEYVIASFLNPGTNNAAFRIVPAGDDPIASPTTLTSGLQPNTRTLLAEPGSLTAGAAYDGYLLSQIAGTEQAYSLSDKITFTAAQLSNATAPISGPANAGTPTYFTTNNTWVVNETGVDYTYVYTVMKLGWNYMTNYYGGIYLNVLTNPGVEYYLRIAIQTGNPVTLSTLNTASSVLGVNYKGSPSAETSTPIRMVEGAVASIPVRTSAISYQYVLTLSNHVLSGFFNDNTSELILPFAARFPTFTSGVNQGDSIDIYMKFDVV